MTYWPKLRGIAPILTGNLRFKFIQFILYIPNAYSGPELQFTLNYIFKRRLGLSFSTDTIEGDYVILRSDEQSVLEFHLGDFFRNTDAYLGGKERPKTIGSGWDWQMFPMGVREGEGFEFDVLAAIFYLIARLEEHEKNGKLDEHGRYPAERSVLYADDMLEYPIVDQWVAQIRNRIESRLGVKVCKEEAFEWWNTVDIDQVYASHGKSLPRRLGNMGRKIVNGELDEFATLWGTLFAERDPFDNLIEMAQSTHRNIAFIQLGGDTDFDKATAIDATHIKLAVEASKNQYEWGLHPSYDTSKSSSILQSEVDMFSSFFGTVPQMSRQHYLRFDLPNTAYQLSQIGIKTDFSMGYASHLGFRAGTSRPFPLFDVKARKPLNIDAVPFSVMDVTLKKYLQLNPQESLERIGVLIERTRLTHGLFVSLWHNESLGTIDGWKGWSDVFDQMAKMLKT